MNSTVVKNLAAIAILVTAVVVLAGPSRALAQRRSAGPSYRNAQYEQQLPDVELPPPPSEGTPLPTTEELIPPSIGQTDGAGEVVLPQVPLDGPVWDGYGSETPCESDAACAPAPVFSTGTWYYRGRWYTQMDFVVLIPTDPRPIRVLDDVSSGVSPITGQFNTSYRNLDLVSRRFAPGTRLTLGRFLGRDVARRDHLIDFSFLGLFDWDDRRTVVSRGGGSLVTNLNDNNSADIVLSPFFFSDEQSYGLRTQLNSFEMDYRIRTRPGRDQLALTPRGNWVRYGNGSQIRSVIAGFRGMAYDESVAYAARTSGNLVRVETVSGDPADVDDPIISDIQSNATDNFTVGDYRVRTNNDMFGIHFGAELVERHDEWTFGFRSRIGGLVDFADRRSRLYSLTRDEQLVSFRNVPRLDANGNPVLDANGDPIIDTVNRFVQRPVVEVQPQKVEDQTLVFIAELGARGSYQVRPNLFLRAGYDVMLMSGLALASENIGFSNGFPQLNAQGTQILHGASWGFETFW